MHLKKKWKSLISCPDIYQYICTWKSKYPSLLLKLINIVSVIIVEKPQKLSHGHSITPHNLFPFQPSAINIQLSAEYQYV